MRRCMAPWNSKPLPSSRTGPSLAPALAPSRAAALVAGIRGSAWSSIVLRAVAVLAGLVVLGWIGRTAAARPTTALSVATADPDAAAPAASSGSPSAHGPALASPAPPAPAPPALAAAALAPPVPAPAPAPPASAPDAPRGRASTADPVYLNHASIDELRRLPGVGPKRAEAILALRQRVGRFHRVEDLLRVKGIGRSAVKKWRPLVRLDSPEAPSALAPADAGSP